MEQINAIGHRGVHGGTDFPTSTLVTPEVIKLVESLRDLAPLHTDPVLMGIRGCLEYMPNTPQVLVFDTAFHKTMPKKAYTYPFPQEYYDKYKIRKYGFHGTSHYYVSNLANEALAKLGITADALAYAKDNYEKDCKLCRDTILAVAGTTFTEAELKDMPYSGLKKLAATISLASGEKHADRSIFGAPPKDTTKTESDGETGSLPPPANVWEISETK